MSGLPIREIRRIIRENPYPSYERVNEFYHLRNDNNALKIPIFDTICYKYCSKIYENLHNTL